MSGNLRNNQHSIQDPTNSNESMNNESSSTPPAIVIHDRVCANQNDYVGTVSTDSAVISVTPESLTRSTNVPADATIVPVPTIQNAQHSSKKLPKTWFCPNCMDYVVPEGFVHARWFKTLQLCMFASISIFMLWTMSGLFTGNGERPMWTNIVFSSIGALALVLLLTYLALVRFGNYSKCPICHGRM